MSQLTAIEAHFYLKQELFVPFLGHKKLGQALVAACTMGMGLGRRAAGTYRSNTKKKKVLDS